MNITGTHINYFVICKRKLWLMSNGITMEHTSDLVHQGNVIHENSYLQRSDKYRELELDGIKIDFYDKTNRVIHEIKKSSKETNAHIWQLKYYIYILDKAGVEGVTGILEYPKERKREEVSLSDLDKAKINTIIEEINKVVMGNCPNVTGKAQCKKCSYYDFCYCVE
ncbi:MAG: CRISPR-associated protein Cas4 [Rikenellaceae bacterium]